MKKILLLFTSAILIACGNEKTNDYNVNAEKKSTQVSEDVIVEQVSKDSLLAITKTYQQFTDKPGNIGIFEVPEMLTLCKLDSAPYRDINFVMAKNFGVLQAEAKNLKAKISGSAGYIAYTNDTANFVFECVLPIAEIPKTQSKKCKVVVLEASNMLIYNYYGNYNLLYRAYANIREYINKNKIKQSGPMREFYITDAGNEPNPEKWLTRIMVPVEKK